MRRRSGTGREPVKARRRKTVTRKRRTAPKAVRRRSPSASGRETEVARLTRELHEALEQQTATSEVLRVISSSPGELEPVFQSMLENAVRICEANYGILYSYSDGAFRTAAHYGVPTTFVDFLQNRGVFRARAGSTLDRMVRTKQVIDHTDISKDDPSNPAGKFGARSFVEVPMLKDDVLVGVIVIYRQEVLPFTDKQIALLKNFAAQAVIAIENTRLLNELRERTTDLTELLEQQTATSEVLRVISSTPGELEPVFQAMLANAVRICDAKFGTLFRYDNDTFDPVAEFDLPPAYAEFHRQQGSFQPPAGTSLDRLLRTKEVVRIVDDPRRLRSQAPRQSSVVRGRILLCRCSKRMC